MRRREVIGLIGVAAAWPLTARAQSKRLPKVGIIGSINARGVLTFVDGMRDLGLIDGHTITIKDDRNIDNDQLARTAAELVADKVDVIFASGSRRRRQQRV